MPAAYTRRLVVHQFRISAPEQLDKKFAGWVHEAYQVGQGGHLAPAPSLTASRRGVGTLSDAASLSLVVAVDCL